MVEREAQKLCLFWDPEFTYDQRPDGSILMQQVGELPAHLPLLADYFDKWADQAPDRAWIARRGTDGAWQRISYGAAREKARAIGGALIEMGLGPDRPLLILSENSLEHALLGIACAYVGIPYAPISPAYSLMSKGAEKAKTIVQTIRPGAIFADDGAKFADALGVLVTQDCKAINARNPVDGAVSFDDLTRGNTDAALRARSVITPDTVVKYLFTSGSTGTPKAVINTNRMICAMQAMVRDCYRFLETEPPVVLNWAPWNHTAAGNKTFYLVLTNGGTYYIDDGRPVKGEFEETLRNLREVPCTWYFNVPIGFDMLVRELEQDAELAKCFYSRLNMLFYAGAGMAQNTWDRLIEIGKEVTGRDILLATGLGATETAPFALAWTEPETKAGNVGVPARGLSLKLVPYDGKLEARLKGPSITPGYFGDAAKTAEVFDDEGYYCLGDALRPADPDDFSRGFFFDGRVAENFKLSTGTWVSVGSVRGRLVDAMGGIVRDAVIVGENQSQLGALLWLSDAALEMDPQTLAQSLAARLSQAAKTATGSASRVRRAMVLPTAPSFDKGEITEKGSLNQRAMRSHNTDVIRKLFESDEDVFIA